MGIRVALFFKKKVAICLSRGICTMSSREVKKLRLDSEVRKVIGTHNGTFHCDEVLACFMLRTLEAYQDAR